MKASTMCLVDNVTCITVASSATAAGSSLKSATSAAFTLAEREMAGTHFCITLVDGDGNTVDRRTGRPDGRANRGAERNFGAPPADDLELTISYGYPVTDPITRGQVGVLQLMCTPRSAPLLGIHFLADVASTIERGLSRDPVGAAHLLFAAYQVAAERRSSPVVAVGHGMVLANQAAADVLLPRDYATLQALRPVDGTPTRRRLRLRRECEATVVVHTVDGTDGVLAELELVPSPASASRTTKPAQHPHGRTLPPELERKLTRYRAQHLSVAITGERGTGRTAVMRALAGEHPVIHLRSSTDVDSLVSNTPSIGSCDSLIVVNEVGSLSETAALALTRLLDTGVGWIALITQTERELPPAHRNLVARCAGRIDLPPLRERIDELPLFIRQKLDALGASGRLTLTPDALRVLGAHPWLGNFHELHELIRHLLRHQQRRDITVDDLPERFRRTPAKRPRSLLEQVEYEAILRALRASSGNRIQAARNLGISRSTLHRRIRTFGIAA